MGLAALLAEAVSVPVDAAVVRVRLLIEAVGAATSEVTVVLATAVQPLAEVTVKLYVPAVLAVVVAVVAPLLHR
ncbi:hypothetical protein GCM10027578_32110 [Spirosoma luteolum]